MMFIPLMLAALYFLVRPHRSKLMKLNGIYFEFPRNMNASLLKEFVPLRDWHESMHRGLLAEGAVVEKVYIRDAYMFGPRIGFLLMNVTMHMNGVALPGAVLLRGKSVVVLLWYRHEGQVYIILIRQPRVATGKMMWEVPAGMADGNGTLRGQMFTEIYEETGLVVDIQDLKSHGVAPYTSCGLLDETCELFSMKISPESIFSGFEDVHGNQDEGELITNIKAFPLSEARTFEDGKLHMLLSVMEL